MANPGLTHAVTNLLPPAGPVRHALDAPVLQVRGWNGPDVPGAQANAMTNAMTNTVTNPLQDLCGTHWMPQCSKCGAEVDPAYSGPKLMP